MLERDTGERSPSKVYAFNQATAEYIEALEAIAKAAYEMWKVTPYGGRLSVAAARREELYDAFKGVNIRDNRDSYRDK